MKYMIIQKYTLILHDIFTQQSVHNFWHLEMHNWGDKYKLVGKKGGTGATFPKNLRHAKTSLILNLVN